MISLNNCRQSTISVPTNIFWKNVQEKNPDEVQNCIYSDRMWQSCLYTQLKANSKHDQYVIQRALSLPLDQESSQLLLTCNMSVFFPVIILILKMIFFPKGASLILVHKTFSWKSGRVILAHQTFHYPDDAIP